MTDNKFTCTYCKKSFSRESSYVNHVCRLKKRWQERDTPAFHIAVSAYQKFYEIEMSCNNKTTSDFIESKFYNDFIKFGRFCIEYDIPYVNRYLLYCIKNKIKLKKWASPLTYDLFIYEYFLTIETPEEAVERSIKEIRKWAERTGKDETRFFLDAELNEAAWMLRTGRISPWLVYIAPTGKNLLDDLTEQHTKELNNILNPNFWHQKFLTNSESVQFLADLLDQYGY